MRSEEERKEEKKASGNGVIELQEGWKYKGEYASGLFHGFGELYHCSKLIYSGSFEFGYFSGYGKLQYHPAFAYLLKNQSTHQQPYFQQFIKIREPEEKSHSFNWNAYFG